MFDFAIIDGAFRWKCLEALEYRIRKGGFIYFDNYDSDKDSKHYQGAGLSASHYAQDAVRRLCSEHNLQVEVHHGMINGELFAGSGILILFS